MLQEVFKRQLENIHLDVDTKVLRPPPPLPPPDSSKSEKLRQRKREIELSKFPTHAAPDGDQRPSISRWIKNRQSKIEVVVDVETALALQ